MNHNPSPSTSLKFFMPAFSLFTAALQILPGTTSIAQATPISTSTITVEVQQVSLGARQLLIEQKGIDLLLDNRPIDAIEKFDEVLVIDPSDIFALNNRANAYMQLGDIKKALADYDLAISFDGSKGFLYFNRANARAQDKQLNEAVADYTEALRLNPQDARSFTNRGNLFIKLANLTAAIADYSAALVIDPNLAKATYNRAHAYRIAENSQGALSDYQLASKLLHEQGFETEARKAERFVATLQQKLGIGQLP
jgi:tetratricopeptide (TPR) repeat protein